MTKLILVTILAAVCATCAPSESEREAEVPSGPQLTPLQVTPELAMEGHVPAEPGALKGSNLILVTLDTTRADRIGCYGNGAIQTPTLDRLAAEGVVFSDVTAVAPITLPSHASLFTGLYPEHHGVHGNGLFRLEESHETLAERLKGEGYRTGAVISAFVLDSQFGLAQGFDHYDDDLSGGTAVDKHHFKERPARATTARALSWLKEVDERPFFLWAHYFDPHHNYAPPSPFDQEYRTNLYDGEIAYVDRALEELVNGVSEAGLGDNTLVAVVGDHGEGLGQHSEMTHSYLVYDATVRVPLILHAGERLGGGIHCTRPASQVDVAPMLLSLLGIAFSESTDAHDLLTPNAEEHPRFAASAAGAFEFGWEPLTSVSLGQYKYIHSSDPELYDRVQDPFELYNLILEQPDVAKGLYALLEEAFGDSLGEAPAPTVEPSMSDVESLQALGYFEGGGQQAGSTGKGVSPRSMMPLLHRVALAEDPAKHPSKQLEDLLAITKESPDFYPAWKAIAAVYKRIKKMDDAAAALERCLALRPDVPQTVFDLAFVRTRQSDFAEALRLLEPLVASYPDYIDARYFYAVILGQLERQEEAIVQFENVLDLAPNHKGCAQRLAGALEASGRGAEILGVLEQRLVKDPLASNVRIAVADLHEAQGDREGADRILRDGLALNPEDGELVRSLVQRLARNRDPAHRDREAAIAVLKPFIARLEPPPVAALLTLSTMYANSDRLEQAVVAAKRAAECAMAEGGDALANSVDAHLKGLEKRAQERDE